ncbi:Nucleoside diphosphate kinase, mitochondrial, partial [Lemmus lemmus]
QERTLIAVKPDGVQRRLVGTVIHRFERRGFKLVGMKMLQVLALGLCCHKKGLGLSPAHLGSPTFSPTRVSVLQVWEGHNVVHISRTMIGHTDSTEAAPGTIRGDFSVHISRYGGPNTLVSQFRVKRASLGWQPALKTEP